MQSSNTRWLVAGVVTLIAFAVLFTGLLLLFRAENVATELDFSSTEAAKPGYVAIDARVISVDPIKGEVAVRLQFDPMGDLAQADGISATEDLRLDLNSSTGKTQVAFKKGERMSPTDVVLDSYGAIGDYPFDSHEAALLLVLTTPSGGTATYPADYEAVPFAVHYRGAVAGYKIDASEEQGAETGFTVIDLSVSRSTSAITFSVFIMALEWLMALSALSAAIVWMRGRKIEVTMFAWMGALLFALIPLRNAMPAVPPVGVLSDFLSFFWAEILVAVSLALSVATWLTRPTAPNK
jgi:hypothetical protein